MKPALTALTLALALWATPVQAQNHELAAGGGQSLTSMFAMAVTMKTGDPDSLRGHIHVKDLVTGEYFQASPICASITTATSKETGLSVGAAHIVATVQSGKLLLPGTVVNIWATDGELSDTFLYKRSFDIAKCSATAAAQFGEPVVKGNIVIHVDDTKEPAK